MSDAIDSEREDDHDDDEEDEKEKFKRNLQSLKSLIGPDAHRIPEDYLKGILERSNNDIVKASKQGKEWLTRNPPPKKSNSGEFTKYSISPKKGNETETSPQKKGKNTTESQQLQLRGRRKRLRIISRYLKPKIIERRKNYQKKEEGEKLNERKRKRRPRKVVFQIKVQ